MALTSENDLRTVRRKQRLIWNRASLTDSLFSWYAKEGRHLPWRSRWPHHTPAYHVFLSELMLQQTVVATVIPYFIKFIERWPDIDALANAAQNDVLSEWAGLGYYARARNLHKAARLISSKYEGRFPEDVSKLQALPGIGPYTAGAISAIAFDRPSIVIDGNIERVLMRLMGIKMQVAKVKKLLRDAYKNIIPATQRSDFPQALMDIGALVCLPNQPRCDICPLASQCAGRQEGKAGAIPLKPSKKSKPVRQGAAYILRNNTGDVLMLTRPQRGLLGGMLSFPSAGWDKSPLELPHIEGLDSLYWQHTEIIIRHVFTHFTAEMKVYSALAPEDFIPSGPYFWQPPVAENWPRLMAKCFLSLTDTD